MEIQLPPYVKLCLDLLEEGGHQAYVVGGCVRDSLLDREPHDWDVCTSAMPEETIAIFPQHKVIPTGLKHGTVTVLMEGQQVEITTLRTEGDYTDHRRPNEVFYTDNLELDLSRRDFTVNAMAYAPQTGLLDPCGGMADLERRTIRCVGDPARRFQEDALRILRLFRFCAKLDFVPDELSLEAAKAHRTDLQYVSAERIKEELKGILTSSSPGHILELMCRLEILQVLIPEFAPLIGFAQPTPYHNRTVDLHTFCAVDHAPADLSLRLALLLHDIAKPQCLTVDEQGQGHFKGHALVGAQMAEKILKRLRFGNKRVRKVCTLIREHDSPVKDHRPTIRRFCARLGPDTVRELIALQIADNQAKDPKAAASRLRNLKRSRRLLETVLEENPCLSIRSMAVDGNDMKALGLRGKYIGATLRELFSKVLYDPSKNDREYLLRQAAILKRRKYTRRKK